MGSGILSIAVQHAQGHVIETIPTMRFHSLVSVSSIITACLLQGQFQLSLIKYALTFIFPNYLPQLLHSLNVAQMYS